MESIHINELRYLLTFHSLDWFPERFDTCAQNT